MAFNPYDGTRVMVSTGSKGRRHFYAGTVAALKNQWKLAGVHIVSEQPEWVVIPDGSTDKGRGGKYARTIHFSEFVDLLTRYPRLTTTTTTASSDQVRTETLPARTPHYNLRALEKRLAELSKPTTTASRLTRREGVSKSKPKRFEFAQTTSDAAIIQRHVEKLASIDNLQRFVGGIISGDTPFHAKLFQPKMDALKRIRHLVVQVLTHFEELRVNLELVVESMPSRLNLSTTSPCDLPKSVGYTLETSWSRFLSTWRPEMLQLFSHKSILENASDDTSRRFLDTETNLYVMYASVACAQLKLRTAFVEWVKATRLAFRNNPQSKPLLFMLEDLDIAFCTAASMVPFSDEDAAALQRLYKTVRTTYQKWFAQEPRETADICAQLSPMISTILASVKARLGLTESQDLIWAELDATANADWTDPSLIDTTLRDAVYSQRYRERVKSLETPPLL